MRAFWAVLIASLGFAPQGMAEDEARITDPLGALYEKTLEIITAETSKSKDKDGETPSPAIIPASEAELGSLKQQGASDNKRVNAITAPVPVESLGIVPREAQTRKVRIGRTGAVATPAAKARKAGSERVLRAGGIPLNLKLPPIPDSSQTTGRTHREVVVRTLAILVTAVKGEGLPQETVNALIADFGIQDGLSPKEAAFIALPNPRTADKVQFAWRYEAAWVMLWALSSVDDLPPPKEIVDVRAIAEIVRGENVGTLLAKTSLRPMEEILDQADLIYRYRWALVDAGMNDRDPPAGLDPGVALERHRALNWLIGYLGQQWDDVTPDT